MKQALNTLEKNSPYLKHNFVVSQWESFFKLKITLFV